MPSRLIRSVGKTIVAALVMLPLALPAAAQPILYVNASAPPGGDGTSWATAYRDLQDALTNAAASGGTVTQIWVAAGTYRPAGPNGDRQASFPLVHGISLYGGFAGGETSLSQRDIAANPTILSGDLNDNDGPDRTTLDDNSYRVLTANAAGSTALLDGFTISGGNASAAPPYDAGAGIYTHGTGGLGVSHCQFVGNFAVGKGGAIFITGNATRTIAACTFLGNRSAAGGAIASENAFPGPSVVNCVFSGNSCAFDGNGSGGGGIFTRSSGNTVVTNCSFYSNTAEYGGALGPDNDSSMVVANSIFWENSAVYQGQHMYVWGPNATLGVTYSDLQGGQAGVSQIAGGVLSWGAGNIDINPLFVDLADDNLRLLTGSPCIDHGDNSAVPAGTATDADGNPRLVDDVCTMDTGAGSPPLVDLGPFEFQSAPPPVARFYVRADATGANTGLSWADALTDLQSALAATSGAYCGGYEIWVAAGTYRPAEPDGNRQASFPLVHGISLYGGFAGTETSLSERNVVANPTILSGDLNSNDGPDSSSRSDNSYRVVVANAAGSTALLDGFTISGGNASAAPPYDAGAGIYTHGEGGLGVSNCQFIGNLALGKGGAIFITGYAPRTIAACTFLGNRSAAGGAIACENAFPGPSVVNCVFSGNSCAIDGNGSGGGGIFSRTSGNTVVTNCSFYSNTAEYGGALGPDNDSSMVVANSIFWENHAVYQGQQMYVWGPNATLSVTYSDVQGGQAGVPQIVGGVLSWGAGNINADPRFVNPLGPDETLGTPDDLLRLCADSPCIDAGDSDAVPDGTVTDIAGGPRLVQNLPVPDTGNAPNGAQPVDMGAWEAGPFEAPAPPKLYVNANASGSDDGTSWPNAFTDLQSAIEKALCSPVLGTEIWVAAGTYRPSRRIDFFDVRSSTFQLVNGVALYGGFAGAETLLSQRNPDLNVTILSGDLNDDDGPSFTNYVDNVYHVVDATGTDSSAVMDGFAILGGHAQCAAPCYNGSGLYMTSSNARVVNCRFAANLATNNGGAVFVGGESSPLFINCVFSGNRAASYGGAAYLEFSSPESIVQFVNCTFAGNTALAVSGAGGAIYSYVARVHIVKCAFSGNAADYCGAIDSDASTSTLVNSILWGNDAWTAGEQVCVANGGILNVSYSDVQAGAAGIFFYNSGPDNLNWGAGNSDTDPLFADADLRLLAGSPCIDAGNNGALVLGIDAGGNLRRFDDAASTDAGSGTAPIVDIGAHEFGSTPIPHRLFVNAAALGTMLGTTWTDAHHDLQFALSTALAAGGKVDEIWVAGGTYRPAGPGDDRNETFRLLSNVAVYGGFAGTESSVAERDLNNPANASILSGDRDGDDGPGYANTSENVYHVVMAGGTNVTAILDGFTIRGGNADALSPDDRGAGLYVPAGRPTLRHIRIEGNTATSVATQIYSDFSLPQLENVSIVGDPMLPDRGAQLIHNQVYVTDLLELEAGTLQVQSTSFDTDPENAGLINLAQGSTLRVSQSPSFDPSEVRTNVTGTGNILIELGQQLVIEGAAIVDLSGTPVDEPLTDCADLKVSGTITANGALVVTDGTIRNTNVDVTLATLDGQTEIVNNDISLIEVTSGFGGEFFVAGTSTVACNHILSYGDRYLDLDPDPAAPNPNIYDNVIDVIITQGTQSAQGELLELRSHDYDCGSPQRCASGAFELAGGTGYDDTWALESLTIEPLAKLNLTNRQGFDFDPGVDLPEALYVKHLRLGAGSVLNTGLQRVYYQTLTDDFDTPLVPDAGAPGLFTNGAQLTDIPVLGFSLKIIAFDDPTAPPANEFDVRIHKRLTDPADGQPAPPAPQLEGAIERIDADPDGQVAIPPGHDGVMDMRTQAPGHPSATSVAAKGAFARAGEDEIVIAFDYLFIADPGDDAELRVYLSDDPDVSQAIGSPLAYVYPPNVGLPGAIGSDQMASFYGAFQRGDLNFTRGTYVELELRAGTGIPSGSARVWIDNFDPQISCTGICGDLNGSQGLEARDYLLLLASYGIDTTEPPPGQNIACLDSPLGKDMYVNLSDLLGWDSLLNNDGLGGCGLDLSSGPPGGGVSLQAAGIALAGKRNVTGQLSQQSDALFAVTAAGSIVDVESPASAPGPGGQQRGNGRLLSDASGALYQLHAAQGLVSVSTGQAVVTPAQNSFQGKTVQVGLLQTDDRFDLFAGIPLLDAAFDPADNNVLYVLPVLVYEPDAVCGPYQAVARLILTGNGSYSVAALYGAAPPAPVNPPIGCTVVPVEDFWRLRELEVSPNGQQLFVTTAEALNDNDRLLVYSTVSGVLQQQVLLTQLEAALKAPIALTVSRAANSPYLYLASGVSNAIGSTMRVFRLDVSGSVTYAGAVDLAGLPCVNPYSMLGCGAAVAALAENAVDGTLWVTGFQTPRVGATYSYAVPPFSCGVPNPCAIFATPLLGHVPPGTNWLQPSPVLLSNTSEITGGDLALPLSAAWQCLASGDSDGNDQRDLKDARALQNCFTGPAGGSIGGNCAVFNYDCDADIALDDYAAFRAQMTGP